MKKSKKFVLYAFNLLLIFSFIFLSSASHVLADATYSWAKSMGGTDSYSISVDSSGNVYTTGYFDGTVDFDPGPGTYNLTSPGGSDMFISKLSSNGDFVWAKSMGWTGFDESRSISVDSSGNVYTTGYFDGTVDFDPGPGTYNLTSPGGSSIFILKLNSNGDFVWAKSMGRTGAGQSIFIDSSGNVYTTGYFYGTTDFDPGAGTHNLTSTGDIDIFISKLNSNGDFVWAKSMSGTNLGISRGISYSISVDSSNNVYTTGSFEDTVDFDPGPGTSNLTPAGGREIFISKLNSNGDFVWAKSMGGTSHDNSSSISVDSSSNVYTTGYFEGIADFDPGPGTYNLTPIGDRDIFISKLDSNGDFVWAKSMGGTYNEGKSISIDSNGNVYTTGYFYDTADFDPGAGTYNLTSESSSDIFILKLSQASLPLVSEITPIGVAVNQNTPSYTFNSNNTGTITYGGSCSSATTSAVIGNNTITLNTLTPGTYSNCTITVTDGLNNVSNILSISPFNIVVHSGGGSSSTPTTSTTITESTINNTVTPPVLENTTTEVTTTVIPPTNTYTSPLDGTIKSCPAFTKHLRVGNRLNDKEEARLWQAFLNTKEEEKLTIDGIYGKQTESAIKRFQNKYKDFILSPWNLISPTGYTYKSTRAYANKLVNCSEGAVTLDNGRVINY